VSSHPVSSTISTIPPSAAVDDRVFTAHSGGGVSQCRASAGSDGSHVTCASGSAEEEESTRVDYAVKVRRGACCDDAVWLPVWLYSSCSRHPPLCLPHQLLPVTVCLPLPPTLHLLPSASATVSFNCRPSPSPPLSLPTCSVSVNLSSSYPPIHLPDRDAAAADAAASTAVNLKVLTTHTFI
jgi:hypothetical protein